MKGGLVAKRIDETPVDVEGVVRMIGEVTSGNQESLGESLEDPKVDDLEEPTTGGVVTRPDKCCPRRRSRKARGHSGRKNVDDPINVGDHTSEATTVSDNKPF